MNAYQGAEGAGRIGRILENCRDARREEVQEMLAKQEKEERRLQEELTGLRQELAELLAKKELEPKRRSLTEQTRSALKKAGVRFVPFFQAVEFAPGLNEDPF